MALIVIIGRNGEDDEDAALVMVVEQGVARQEDMNKEKERTVRF